MGLFRSRSITAFNDCYLCAWNKRPHDEKVEEQWKGSVFMNGVKVLDQGWSEGMKEISVDVSTTLVKFDEYRIDIMESSFNLSYEINLGSNENYTIKRTIKVTVKPQFRPEASQLCEKIFSIYRTVLEMVEDRGYLVGPDLKDMQIGFFQERYADEILARRGDELTLLFRKKDDPSDFVFIFWPESPPDQPAQKLNMKDIMKYVKRMKDGKVSRAIVIVQHGLTPYARNINKDLYNQFNMHFEYFDEDELRFNITRHILVPKHQILTKDEKVRLLDRYQMTDKQLPQLFRDDPVARYYGLLPGQVVKILRPSETAGKYITYRIPPCFHSAMAKYNAHDDIESVLYSADDIQKRVKELADEINRDYVGKEIVVVGILKGSFIFMADLVRHLEVKHRVEFMAVSSYTGTQNEDGSVRIIMDLRRSINGQDCIIVEDIIDSGNTLKFLLHYLNAREPTSLKICTLLRKKERLKADVDVAYLGFDIPNHWVVGYGLDYNECYRTLPYVGILKKSVYS